MNKPLPPVKPTRPARWGRRALMVTSLVPLAFVSFLVLKNPHEVSRSLLRTGGRFLKEATDNTPRVALGLLLGVAMIWGIILLACMWEWTKQRGNAD